jgi:hypothetical protein
MVQRVEMLPVQLAVREEMVVMATEEMVETTMDQVRLVLHRVVEAEAGEILVLYPETERTAEL